MSHFSLWFGSAKKSVASRRKAPSAHRLRAEVEELEDRLVPSFFPPTTNGIAVFEDQLPSLDNALTQFMATHTDGTQKQTLSQVDTIRPQLYHARIPAWHQQQPV
jgi:hypothetical protein